MKAYWKEADKKRRDKFGTLLEDSKNDPILDLEFMNALAANYRRLNDRQRKRQIVIVTATLLLFVALVLPDVHLSFTGVGLEAKKLREILLVTLSVASAMRFFLARSTLYRPAKSYRHTSRKFRGMIQLCAKH